MIDLTTLPAPRVVEALSYEAILAAAKADFAERLRPHLPNIDEILQLESDPVVKLLESHAYRELLYRARVNDAALAHLLAFATGADLDHKGAFYGLARLDGESDERYRRRIQLRVRALAGNGTREHYELAALTASQSVRDAIATQPQAGRACNAVRMARNEAAHASDRTAAAQAAIRFNEAVEELEAGYEGTALTTGDLEKYYRMAEDFLSRCGASETIEPQKKAEDEAPRRQKSQKSGSTSRKRQSGGSRTTSKGTSGRSRNTSGRNSRSRQNMQTTARRKKRQRTQSRALTVVLLAVVLLGLLVRAWTMGLMK